MVVLLFLFLCAVIIIDIPFNNALLQFTGISFLYILFWFTVSFFIISLNKKSGVNAVSLLSIWLLLTAVLPAAVNNYISTSYPVPEALSTMLKQRDGYHRKWDMPKEQTLQQFYEVYPQYKNLQWSHEGFDWLWYYAMQHSGDLDAREDKQAFMQKLEQRNDISFSAALFIPSVNVQLQLNELSQSSLRNYIRFLDSTSAFHLKKRLYFYPKIFKAAPVSEEQWDKHTIVYHQPESFSLPVKNIISLVVFCLLPILMGVINLKRINH